LPRFRKRALPIRKLTERHPVCQTGKAAPGKISSRKSQEKYSRVMVSATQQGLSPPSNSTVISRIICKPPVTSPTSFRRVRLRTLEPTLTGEGKRTLFRP